jgi:ATP-dependent protease ClpP protease subunit
MNLRGMFTDSAVYIHTGPIDEYSASAVLTWLAGNSHLPELTIIFMTPGGKTTYAFGIYDAIKDLSTCVKINLVALGLCQSAGIILMCAVEPDRRYAGKNTRFMVHSVSSSSGGISIPCDPEQPSREAQRAVEAIIGFELDEAYCAQRKLVKVLIAGTNLTKKKIGEMLKRDSYFSAKAALKKGLIGHIL